MSGSVVVTDELWSKIKDVLARRFPVCRDCADECGTCPNSGLPCDLNAAVKNPSPAQAGEAVAWRWRSRSFTSGDWLPWDASTKKPPYESNAHYQIEPLFRPPLAPEQPGEAWAVVGPDGTLNVESGWTTEELAWRGYALNHDIAGLRWKQWLLDEGYTCCQVTITPAIEGSAK